MQIEVNVRMEVERGGNSLHATRPPIRLVPKWFSGGRQGSRLGQFYRGLALRFALSYSR
jgi:hypothetical protein